MAEIVSLKIGSGLRPPLAVTKTCDLLANRKLANTIVHAVTRFGISMVGLWHLFWSTSTTSF